MSRKDFVAIAKVIRDQQAAWLECNSGTNPMLHRVAEGIGNYMKATNPLFDRVRFDRACNPES